MGRNTRTYKFALGQTLLQFGRSDIDSIPLDEFVIPYIAALAEHARTSPQAPGSLHLGTNDFLRILHDEAAVGNDLASERLTGAAAASVPRMVMQKFHNLPGGETAPHQFYSLRGPSSRRVVVLSDALRSVAQDPSSDVFDAELGARWALVETAFDAGISRGLLTHGARLSPDGNEIVEPIRRIPITSSRDALSGFQHGRCFYCFIGLNQVSVQIDHVYPFALMKWPSWSGPDLNGVWNLVVACADCNRRKSDRLPREDEVGRLLERNEWIVGSPHPLSRAIISLTGKGANHRRRFFLALERQVGT